MGETAVGLGSRPKSAKHKLAESRYGPRRYARLI